MRLWKGTSQDCHRLNSIKCRSDARSNVRFALSADALQPVTWINWAERERINPWPLLGADKELLRSGPKLFTALTHTANPGMRRVQVDLYGPRLQRLWQLV